MGDHSGFTATGAIDLNDKGITNATDYCEMSILPANKAASDAITATTYLKIAGTTTAGEASTDFTVTTTSGGRITYDGATTKKFKVTVTFSMTSTQSNEVSRFRLATAGDATTAAAQKTEIQRKLGTGSDSGAAAISGIFELATNGYVELWCTLDASTADTITVESMNMLVTEV